MALQKVWGKVELGVDPRFDMMYKLLCDVEENLWPVVAWDPNSLAKRDENRMCYAFLCEILWGRKGESNE